MCTSKFLSHWGITSIPCLFITTSVYCCFEVVCFLFVLLGCQATCPFFGEMISFCSCGHCVFWRLHVGTGTTLKSPMLFLFALQSTVIVASMDGALLIYSIAFSLFSYIGFFFFLATPSTCSGSFFSTKVSFLFFLSFLLDPCSTCLHAAIFRAEENFDLEFLKCYKNRFWRIIHFCLTWIPCALLLWVVSSNCFMFYLLE